MLAVLRMMGHLPPLFPGAMVAKELGELLAVSSHMILGGMDPNPY